MKRKTLIKIIVTIIVIIVVSSVLLLRGTYIPFKTFFNKMSVDSESSEQPLPSGSGKSGGVTGAVS